MSDNVAAVIVIVAGFASLCFVAWLIFKNMKED